MSLARRAWLGPRHPRAGLSGPASCLAARVPGERVAVSTHENNRSEHLRQPKPGRTPSHSWVRLRLKPRTQARRGLAKRCPPPGLDLAVGGSPAFWPMFFKQ
eukprot:3567492-Alexandrium_andersonii.AAC.1